MDESLLYYRLAIFILVTNFFSHFQQQFHIIKQRVKVKQRKVRFFLFPAPDVCTSRIVQKVFLVTV